MKFTVPNGLFKIFSAISLIVSIYCALISQNERYSLVYLLPFSFFLLNTLFKSNLQKISKYVAFTIIYVQIVIRYVVIPCLISSGAHFIAGFYSNNVDLAVAIMVLEVFSVFIAFNIVSSKITKQSITSKKIVFFSRAFFIVLILIIGIIYILTKQKFLLKTNFVWNMSDYYLDEANREAAKEAENIDSLIFFRLRLLMILFLIGILWKARSIGTKWKWGLSSLAVFLNATIIEGSSRFSIVYVTFPFVLILIQLYPEYKRKMMLVGSIIACLILIVASLVKFSSSQEEADANDILNANVLNAYFGGTGNVALGIDAYDYKQTADGISYLVSDLFQNVPGLARRVNENYRTTRIFNYQYYGSSFGKDQIVPVSISALFHFGYLFSFTYSFLFCLLAFRLESLANASTFIASKYVLFLLTLNCSLFMMLNIGSIVSNLIVQPLLTLLPLLVLERGFFILKK